jgi:hypothetical protein
MASVLSKFFCRKVHDMSLMSFSHTVSILSQIPEAAIISRHHFEQPCRQSRQTQKNGKKLASATHINLSLKFEYPTICDSIYKMIGAASRESSVNKFSHYITCSFFLRDGRCFSTGKNPLLEEQKWQLLRNVSRISTLHIPNLIPCRRFN